MSPTKLLGFWIFSLFLTLFLFTPNSLLLASETEAISPIDEISIEDDISLDDPEEDTKPVDIKKQDTSSDTNEKTEEKRVEKDSTEASIKKAIEKTQKKKSPKRNKPRRRVRIRRVKKEKISEISKLRMKVADLIKKVGEVERAQQKAAKKRKDEVVFTKETLKKLDKKADSGNDQVKLTVSGHLNRAVIHLDNGNRTRLKHVDNDNSPTRFRFEALAHLNECFSMGGKIEIQVEENSTADINVNETEDATGTNISVRHAHVFFVHKYIGKVFMGQASSASDDTTEQDLSGTYVTTQASGIEGPATSVRFVDKTIGDQSTITVGNVWTGMDGNSRRNLIRYDTPQVLGFVFGTSHTSADSWDVSGKFKGEYKGFKLAAGLGFLKRDQANKAGFKQLSGSISALTPIGFNATFAAGKQDFYAPGRKTAKYWLVRLGFKLKLLKIGYTAIAADYGQQRDFLNSSTYGNGSTAETYGASFVQKVDKLASEIYFTVRKYGLCNVPQQADGTSVTTPDFEDIWIAMAGARIKF